MIDIRWFGLIEKYLIDGDITELESLIREVGVPIQFANQIADILAGKLKPKSPQKSIIAKRTERYKTLLMHFKSARKKGGIYEMAYSQFNIGEDPKKIFTSQLLAQYLFPNHDKDDARNEMYKLIRKHNLPKLKD